jgi:hypothetical protein
MKVNEKVSYTAGPWQSSTAGSSEGIHRVIRDESGIRIADVGFFHHEQSEELANAKLIAAAPDLLEALKRIAAMDVTHSQAAILARNEAVDAIAKAEGR